MKVERTAVVTGSVRGLGFETARQLSDRGYRVIITGRSAANGEEALARLRKAGASAEFYELDVSDPESIDTFHAILLRTIGQVDVLVNNAGIMIDDERSATLQSYAAALARTFQTNAIGPFLMCKAFVPAMIQRGFGRVVNVTSGMGLLSEMNSGYPGYRMSKSALNAVTRMFSDDAKDTNVLINSVCPGWVSTDMGGSDAPRSVEEGADGIVWAATLPDGGPTGGVFRDRKPIAW
jgi:NAD(P)-dependent dehydrogenase (short-subunit alcohol dehydrogenase family)